MIVGLYNTTDHTFKSLESEYGVTSATIQRWVKAMTPMNPEDSDSMTPQKLIEIKKEMTRMKNVIDYTALKAIHMMKAGIIIVEFMEVFSI